jgi:hypothetical protein
MINCIDCITGAYACAVSSDLVATSALPFDRAALLIWQVSLSLFAEPSASCSSGKQLVYFVVPLGSFILMIHSVLTQSRVWGGLLPFGRLPEIPRKNADCISPRT